MQKHSTIEVLGCSGSIGIPGQGTTSFLLDQDILIDAGTGLCGLPFERLEPIEHVFLTHTHLDHICSLPFLVDTVGVERKSPLKVYGLEFTINSLKNHIFNNSIWPDFTKIPNENNPVLEYHVIESGTIITLSDRSLHFVEVCHTVPALGVLLKTPTGTWAFSGDTHKTIDFYHEVNKLASLDYFFIESAFPDKERWLADLAKHLCPQLLSEELQKLDQSCQVWVSHLKPREYDLIASELKGIQKNARELGILSAGQVFHI